MVVVVEVIVIVVVLVVVVEVVVVIVVVVVVVCWSCALSMVALRRVQARRMDKDFISVGLLFEGFTRASMTDGMGDRSLA